MPGGAVFEDELVYVSHRFETPTGVPTTVYLGHVFVESKRHAGSFADLTDDEAGRVGLVAARVSEAMKAALGADYVFAAVIGTGVAHFHLHLLARYPETPRELAWHSVAEWEDAPRGGESEIAAVTERIRAQLPF